MVNVVRLAGVWNLYLSFRLKPLNGPSKVFDGDHNVYFGFHLFLSALVKEEDIESVFCEVIIRRFSSVVSSLLISLPCFLFV